MDLRRTCPSLTLTFLLAGGWDFPSGWAFTGSWGTYWGHVLGAAHGGRSSVSDLEEAIR